MILVLVQIIMQSNVFAQDEKQFEWGPSTNQIQISLSLVGNPAKIKVGSSIPLLIQIRNASTNEAFNTSYSGGCGPAQGLAFTIIKKGLWDENVSPEFPKDYYAGFSIADISAKPSQTVHFPYDLHILQKVGFLKKLNHPGTYQVIAELTGTMGAKTFTVVSNPLILILTDQ